MATNRVETVGRDELARILGLSPTMVNRLQKDGMPRLSHGKYDLADCVQWYIETWRKRAEGHGTGNLWDEKKKQVIAQTARTELENAKLREEMIPVDVVSRVLNEVGVIISTQLDGLGPRCAPHVASLSDTAQVERILFDESRAIRAAIAGSIQDYAALPGDGDDHRTTAKKKRQPVGRPKKKPAARKSRARTVQK